MCSSDLDLVACQRTSPGPGLLGRLLGSRRGEGQLNEKELVEAVSFLLVTGHQPVVSAISRGGSPTGPSSTPAAIATATTVSTAAQPPASLGLRRALSAVAGTAGAATISRSPQARPRHRRCGRADR